MKNDKATVLPLISLAGNQRYARSSIGHVQNLRWSLNKKGLFSEDVHFLVLTCTTDCDKDILLGQTLLVQNTIMMPPP